MKHENTGEKLNKEKNMSPRYALNDKLQNKALLGVVFIVLSALCYSLMSLFVRLAGELPTFQKAFFRNFVAAILGFVVLLKSGSFQIKKGSLPALLGRSIAGAVGILCNFTPLIG